MAEKPYLVLAVEPDHRQATVVKRLVKERLLAELLLAESKDGALAALGDRVPDVVLLSALLSPRDESELTDHLRGLEDAEHVQTITIPVFAASAIAEAEEPKRKGGLFGKFSKKARSATRLSGCDPAVFGDELVTYCEKAREVHAERVMRLAHAARRRELEANEPASPWAVVAKPGSSAPIEPAADEPPRIDYARTFDEALRDAQLTSTSDLPVIDDLPVLPALPASADVPAGGERAVASEQSSRDTPFVPPYVTAPVIQPEPEPLVLPPPPVVERAPEPPVTRKPSMWLDRATTVTPRPELDKKYVAPQPPPVTRYSDHPFDALKISDNTPFEDESREPAPADADGASVIDLSAELNASEDAIESEQDKPDLILGPIPADALAEFQTAGRDADAETAAPAPRDPDRIELPSLGLRDFERAFQRMLRRPADRKPPAPEVPTKPRVPEADIASAPKIPDRPPVTVPPAASFDTKVREEPEPDEVTPFVFRSFNEPSPPSESAPAIDLGPELEPEVTTASDSFFAPGVESAAAAPVESADILGSLGVSPAGSVESTMDAAAVAASALEWTPAAEPPAAVKAATPVVETPTLSTRPVGGSVLFAEPEQKPARKSPVAAARMLIAAATRSLTARTPAAPPKPAEPDAVPAGQLASTPDARWITSAIDALRLDIQLLREDRERKAAAAAAQAAAAAAAAAAAVKAQPAQAPAAAKLTKAERLAAAKAKKAKKKKAKPKGKPKPLQDEWGVYDPTQAGFEALMAEVEARQEEEEWEEPEPEVADQLLQQPKKPKKSPNPNQPLEQELDPASLRSQFALEPQAQAASQPPPPPRRHRTVPLNLMPLAMWARVEHKDVAVVPSAGQPTPDDLLGLMGGLRVPAPVASVRYASGARIQRVRIAADPNPPPPPDANEPVIILSKKTLKAAGKTPSPPV